MRCDSWHDILVSARKLSYVEKLRWAYLKRKYGKSVVLNRWHMPSMRGERVRVRDEYSRKQVDRWGRLMGRYLVRCWFYENLGDATARNHLGRRQFSVAAFLGLVESETMTRVDRNGELRRREDWEDKHGVCWGDAPKGNLSHKVPIVSE